jgi:hypothetical protein
MTCLTEVLQTDGMGIRIWWGVDEATEAHPYFSMLLSTLVVPCTAGTMASV